MLKFIFDNAAKGAKSFFSPRENLREIVDGVQRIVSKFTGK